MSKKDPVITSLLARHSGDIGNPAIKKAVELQKQKDQEAQVTAALEAITKVDDVQKNLVARLRAIRAVEKQLIKSIKEIDGFGKDFLDGKEPNVSILLAKTSVVFSRAPKVHTP